MQIREAQISVRIEIRTRKFRRRKFYFRQKGERKRLTKLAFQEEKKDNRKIALLFCSTYFL